MERHRYEKCAEGRVKGVGNELKVYSDGEGKPRVFARISERGEREELPARMQKQQLWEYSNHLSWS